MLNEVKLIGRVIRKPELRHTNGSQKPVTNIDLAENYYVQGENNQTVERTRYHSVVAWDGKATSAAQHLCQGRMILVEAYVNPIKKTIEGKNYNFNELVVRSIKFLDNKKDHNQQDGQVPNNQQGFQPNPNENQGFQQQPQGFHPQGGMPPQGTPGGFPQQQPRMSGGDPMQSGFYNNNY